MPNLQYLALGKTSRWVRAGNEWAKQLFETLRMATKLHRIDLKGDWILSSRILVEFVEQHMGTLRCLSLHGCFMEGRWLATLHSLADLLRDNFEYFRLLNPYQIVSGVAARATEDFNTCHRSQWPEFTCITDFGPELRLLPDPNKAELDERSD